MINNFILYPQAKKVVEITDELYYKNSTPNNASKKIWKANTYKSIEHVYLIEFLARDYIKLELTDKEYLYKRVLKETSSLAVMRTKDLDINTRKQVFLKCCELNTQYKYSASELSPLMKKICKAFDEKDFKAWKIIAQIC